MQTTSSSSLSLWVTAAVPLEQFWQKTRLRMELIRAKKWTTGAKSVTRLLRWVDPSSSSLSWPGTGHLGQQLHTSHTGLLSICTSDSSVPVNQEEPSRVDYFTILRFTCSCSQLSCDCGWQRIDLFIVLSKQEEIGLLCEEECESNKVTIHSGALTVPQNKIMFSNGFVKWQIRRLRTKDLGNTRMNLREWKRKVKSENVARIEFTHRFPGPQSSPLYK